MTRVLRRFENYVCIRKGVASPYETDRARNVTFQLRVRSVHDTSTSKCMMKGDQLSRILEPELFDYPRRADLKAGQNGKKHLQHPLARPRSGQGCLCGAGGCSQVGKPVIDMTTPAVATVDAHHHLWRHKAAEFDWIDDRMAALRRDFTADDFREAMACGKVTLSDTPQSPARS